MPGELFRFREFELDRGAFELRRAAYQYFFALWKDADPDVPILKAAKAEFAKLKYGRRICGGCCRLFVPLNPIDPSR